MDTLIKDIISGENLDDLFQKADDSDDDEFDEDSENDISECNTVATI